MDRMGSGVAARMIADIWRTSCCDMWAVTCGPAMADEASQSVRIRVTARFDLSRISRMLPAYFQTQLERKAPARHQELRDRARDGWESSSFGWRDRNSRR